MKATANFVRVSEDVLSDGSSVYNVNIYYDEDHIMIIPCLGETEANALLYSIKVNSTTRAY